MTLEEVKKVAEALEMFGPDGIDEYHGKNAVEFGQAVLALIAELDSLRGGLAGKRHQEQRRTIELLRASLKDHDVCPIHGTHENRFCDL